MCYNSCYFEMFGMLFYFIPCLVLLESGVGPKMTPIGCIIRRVLTLTKRLAHLPKANITLNYDSENINQFTSNMICQSIAPSS